MRQLASHDLDLVLSNRPVQRQAEDNWHCRRIARQQVSLVGRPGGLRLSFPDDVAGMPLLLPGLQSEIRTAFDALCEHLGVQTNVVAEVDDMAMMRLLARDTNAIALLPSVVVRDELQSGMLQEHCVVPSLYENFYAITVERRYPHPLVRPLLARTQEDILAMGQSGPET